MKQAETRAIGGAGGSRSSESKANRLVQVHLFDSRVSTVDVSRSAQGICGQAGQRDSFVQTGSAVSLPLSLSPSLSLPFNHCPTQSANFLVSLRVFEIHLRNVSLNILRSEIFRLDFDISFPSALFSNDSYTGFLTILLDMAVCMSGISVTPVQWR